MYKHELLRARPYRNEPVSCAHVKRNGHRLILCKDGAGRISAYTTLPSDVTSAARLQPWWAPVYRRMPPDTVVEGELFHPSRPPSYVKTALAGKGDGLRFEVFAVPSLPHDMELGTVEALVMMWGMVFVPWEKLGAGWTAQGLLEKAEELGHEGWVLKRANYEGWFKLKPVRTVDLIVTGFKDGDGKYVGLVGSLRCSTVEGREVASVSGMTDEQRVDVDEKKDLGRVVEVAYQYVGARGRLIHPRFVRWRDDKLPEGCGLDQDHDLEEYWGEP